jgi:hypothetical protein
VGGIVHTLTGGYELAFLSGGILGIVASGLVLMLEKDPGRVRAELAKAALPA